MSPATGDSGFRLLRRVLLWMISVEVGVLVLTGLVLSFGYQPSDSAWQAFLDGRGNRGAQLSRVVHQVTSAFLGLTALVAPLLLTIREGARVRAWTGFVVGIGIVVAALAASFSGFLLPWDQLALWAVEVGTNYQGYLPLFGDDVRFVITGGVEFGTDTIIRWLVVHLGASGAVVGLVGLAWRRHHVLHRQAEN